MSLAGMSVSLFALVAVVSAILAVATIWLVLTDPVTVADAVSRGNVTPLVKELADVIAQALQGLLRYL
jgi:hypothetical protein